MRGLKRFFKIIMSLLILGILALALIVGIRTYKFTNNVNQHRGEVQAAAKKNGVENYTDVLLGIIYTESKGKGGDLMQSSESAYGTTGQIDTSSESIEKGVEHFAESLKEAKAAGCDLDTAIQAYNFGFQYINFVKRNGGKNSTALADEYSRDVLAPSMGNAQATQYRYLKWQAFVYNGGYLYRNGGNLFYAELVAMNQKIVDLFQKFQ